MPLPSTRTHQRLGHGSGDEHEGHVQGATAFNQDIRSWDTAQVTDMEYMFNGAKAFSGDLSGWNVLAVVKPNSCQDFCVDAGSSLKRPLLPNGNCGEPGCSKL